MLTRKHLSRIALGAVTVALSASLLYAASQEKISFRVHNKSNLKIVKLLVSEDGENYGHFNISAGIKAGATVKLAWNTDTEGETCEQYVKAVFSDGRESEPAQFNRSAS
jgi:hypothetical protein